MSLLLKPSIFLCARSLSWQLLFPTHPYNGRGALIGAIPEQWKGIMLHAESLGCSPHGELVLKDPISKIDGFKVKFKIKLCRNYA